MVASIGVCDRDGEIHHRPGRDVTLSAPKSVSLMALVGGEERIVAAHDRAVGRHSLGWSATPSRPGCRTGRRGRWSLWAAR